MVAVGRFTVTPPPTAPDPTAYLLLRLACAAACVTGGLLIARSRTLFAAWGRMGDFESRVLVAGAALIAGCFFASQNIGYRGVHLILALAGLLALRREAGGPARGLLAALAVGVVLLMWDGAFRHILELHGRRTTRALYWLTREVLWHVLVAVLIGMLGLYVRRSPLWRRRLFPPRAPA
jgi:hypothetical protein